MSANDLDASIRRRIAFLRCSLLPSGEFKAYMSPDLKLQSHCVFDSSPFPTALIAYSLGFDDSGGADDVLNKALPFLLNAHTCYR